MTSILERLIQLEAEILYRMPPEQGQNEFAVLPGTIPVLLSAPHGAVHTRYGRLKDEDEYTAAISRLVAEQTGAHVIYARRISATDPNFYADVPYKQALQQIVDKAKIGFVLDIHGSSARRDFGMALGTIQGKACPAQRALILRTLAAMGFASALPHHSRLDVDQVFPGAGNSKVETVTRFAWRKLGVPAAQIEINAHLRIVRRKPDASLPGPFAGDPLLIEKTVIAMIELVRALSN